MCWSRLAVDVRNEEKLLVSLDHETREVHGTEVVLHLGEIGHQRGQLVGERLGVGGIVDREVDHEMTLAHRVLLEVSARSGRSARYADPLGAGIS